MQVARVSQDRPTETTDRELFERVRNGDADALAALCSRCDRWMRALVYATVGSADAVDDVMQMAWLRVWRKSTKLGDTARWKAWIATVARNAARDALRKHRRRRKFQQSVAERARQEPRHEVPADAPLRAHEQTQRILQAVHRLPTKYREAFILRHLDEMSPPEIAELLDVPEATVVTRLWRARKRLRDSLANEAAQGRPAVGTRAAPAPWMGTTT